MLEQELENAREFEDKFHEREEQNRSLKTMIGNLQRLVEKKQAQLPVQVHSVSLDIEKLRYLIQTAETTREVEVSTAGQRWEDYKSELAKAKHTLRIGEAELMRSHEVTSSNMRAALRSLSEALRYAEKS